MIKINIEEIARQVGCIHVDLAGDRAKAIERMTAFAAEVIKCTAIGSADPVATVIKKGADRTWMSERLGALPDGTYSLFTAPPATKAKELLRQIKNQLWYHPWLAHSDYSELRTLLEQVDAIEAKEPK